MDTTKRPVGRPPLLTRDVMREVARRKRAGASYEKLARELDTSISSLRTAVRTIAREETGHEV